MDEDNTDNDDDDDESEDEWEDVEGNNCMFVPSSKYSCTQWVFL